MTKRLLVPISKEAMASIIKNRLEFVAGLLEKEREVKRVQAIMVAFFYPHISINQ